MDRQVKGILGAKLGMTQVWDNNKVVPVTVVQAGPCVVTQVRTAGQGRLLGGPARLRRDQPAQGEQARGRATSPRPGVAPRRHLVELRTTDASEYTLGQEVTVETFAAGQPIDVTGKTKGKGFAGVMKRHGFHGLQGQPRCRAQAPLARLDRRLRDPGSRLQGRADGRPDGWRALHRAGPDHPGGRPEQNLILVTRRDPGPQGRAWC